MLISNKSKEIIDSCRFCWMCRHICPIGNATGQERNTARARALSLSLVERGAAKLEGSIVDNVYECALCGACTKDCATGWDPVKFTKEVRLEAALNDQTPAYITKMLESVAANKNPYGVKEIASDLAAEIKKHADKKDTVLILGADARYVGKDSAIAAMKVLDKAGVEYTVLADEPDTGYVLDTLLGAASETKEVMEKFAKEVSGFKTIITVDPADAKTLLREYKEWNIDLKAEVITFTALCAKLLADGKISLKSAPKKYSVQDSFFLARDLEEDNTRGIVEKIGDICDMLLVKKETVWAGSILLREYIPNVIDKVASRRLDDAKRVGGECVVFECVGEYEAAKKIDGGIDIISIHELIADNLK